MPEMSDTELSSLVSPVFVLGAAYSGKSALAQRTLLREERVLVLGTADLSEGLLAARVEELRRSRPTHWQHLEVGEHLLEALQSNLEPSTALLIDSINLWFANRLLHLAQKYSPAELQASCQQETTELVHQLRNLAPHHRITLVSSEVGAGVTPPKPMARLFRQEVSRLNYQLAALSQSVLLVSAGIPLLMKGA